MRLQLVGVLFLIVGVFLAACTEARPTPTPIVAAPPTETPVVLEDVVVERVEVRILESFPVQVEVGIYGLLPDACSLIQNVAQARAGDTFEITLEIARRPDARCAPNPTPFEHTVPLDVVGLQAGTYTVDVHGVRQTFELAVDNRPLDAGLISGRVWHDVCAIAGGEGGAPAVPSSGCVSEGGGYRANGLLEANEPGIEGVQVTLGQGACPAEGLAAAVTDAAGLYVFNDLDAGTYCVAVNPLHEPNASILLPGGWTAPGVELGSVTVNLGPGAQRTDVNFGWDYQFLPSASPSNDDESAAFAAWLKETLAARDYGQVQTLMTDPFTIAGWRSEGQSYAPAQAVEQLVLNHLGPNTHLAYPEQDVTVLLGGADPFAIFGPEARIVRILLADGWGLEGTDEALLYISQAADGEFKWYGVLTAFGGFGQTSALLTWHREGGIAGFCDDLAIYGAGDAHAMSCAGPGPRELGVGLLGSERRVQLQAWVGQYAPLAVERTDAPLAADGMTIRLSLYGTGQVEAGDAEVQAILDFAAQVFNELGAVQEADVRYVMAQADLRIRSGPGPDYEAIGQVFGGQTALVTGKSLDGGWWRVICPDDRVGSCWVPAGPQYTLPRVPETCPEPAEGTALLVQEAHGYCLLYPSGYSVERPNPEETVLVVGSLLSVSDPRLYIQVSDANGRTLEQAADAVVADFPGFEIQRDRVTIGGQDAVVLDGVPGQDISRQALVVHNGRLYRLTFVPASEDAGEVFTRMQEFYQMVAGSFAFLD